MNNTFRCTRQKQGRSGFLGHIADIKGMETMLVLVLGFLTFYIKSYPSTSFLGSMASMTLPSSICEGKGIWTMIP
jgi:hypothetical protein